jgi:arginyl-tRNA synthetase
MDIYNIIIQALREYLRDTYSADLDRETVQIQKTRKEFEGDLTLVVFPLLRITRKSPEQTGEEIGSHLVEACPEIEGCNVIKGFLNLTISKGSGWINWGR